MSLLYAGGNDMTLIDSQLFPTGSLILVMALLPVYPGLRGCKNEIIGKDSAELAPPSYQCFMNAF